MATAGDLVINGVTGSLNSLDGFAATINASAIGTIDITFGDTHISNEDMPLAGVAIERVPRTIHFRSCRSEPRCNRAGCPVEEGSPSVNYSGIEKTTQPSAAPKGALQGDDAANAKG
jgi:hypothetical protein